MESKGGNGRGTQKVSQITQGYGGHGQESGFYSMCTIWKPGGFWEERSFHHDLKDEYVKHISESGVVWVKHGSLDECGLPLSIGRSGKKWKLRLNREDLT